MSHEVCRCCHTNFVSLPVRRVPSAAADGTRRTRVSGTISSSRTNAAMFTMGRDGENCALKGWGRDLLPFSFLLRQVPSLVFVSRATLDTPLIQMVSVDLSTGDLGKNYLPRFLCYNKWRVIEVKTLYHIDQGSLHQLAPWRPLARTHLEFRVKIFGSPHNPALRPFGLFEATEGGVFVR